MSQSTSTDRIEAEIGDVSATIGPTCEAHECSAVAERELFDGTRLCERHFGRVVSDVAAIAEPATLTRTDIAHGLIGPVAVTDPIREARNHIRAAMGIAATVELQMRAYACDDDWDQPNDGTAINAELALALECLR